MRLILISGLSGSGKSVALKFLEDLGFYCVDNLPLFFLKDIVNLHQQTNLKQLAISVDIRSGEDFEDFPAWLNDLKNQDINVDLLFLEASELVLLKRFSETRRRHPLAIGDVTLAEAIALEKVLLDPIRQCAHCIDTSLLLTQQLRQFVRQWLNIPNTQIKLVFESFGFKFGLPVDADYVFDVRCLPNPHYDLALRSLTGLDQPVCDFFQDKKDVWQMIDSIEAFINQWLPRFEEENKMYLTVAIGCTGGQHRSVFICQHLAQRFVQRHAQVRHRQIGERIVN